MRSGNVNFLFLEICEPQNFVIGVTNQPLVLGDASASRVMVAVEMDAETRARRRSVQAGPVTVPVRERIVQPHQFANPQAD